MYMPAVHDLPYPYDAARWANSYAALGFDPSTQPAWLISLVDSYYAEGNRSALRNRVMSAKRWATTHNKPVICNEFGAYAVASRLEDRVRYYRDMVGIFQELEIPWQHWFMVIDPQTGAIDAEIRDALGL